MTAQRTITVKIIYRHYKPLHKMYESLVDMPPSGVNYLVPKPATYLERAKFIYRKYKSNRLVRAGMRLVSKLIFSAEKTDESVDLYHYINMISGRSLKTNKPYVVELERATSLTGFTPDKRVLKAVSNFLLDDNCAAIICTSQAAAKSLERLVGNDWPAIKRKIEIIYSTMPLPKLAHKDNSIIKNDSKLKLLFVGNQSGRKGLPELMAAIKGLNEKYLQKLELFIVSADADEIIHQYQLPNVHLFKPVYTKAEMLSKFFLPADLLIFPTRGDTYGMAVIDALAAGTPIIATKQFALPELIKHGQDGLLIDVKKPALDNYLFIPRQIVKKLNSNVVKNDVAKQLVKAISPLINNRAQIKKWSKNTRRKFADDHQLSITRRNKQYLRLYRRALSSSNKRG